MAVKNDAVFVDSNFFIALFNKRDSLRKKADSILSEIDDQSLHVYISNYIFSEIVTVSFMQAGRSVAVTAGELLLAHPRVHIVHIDEVLQSNTWKIFTEVTGKNISFVNCSTIAAMRSEGIRTLLTFDTTDFKKLRAKYRFSFFLPKKTQ